MSELQGAEAVVHGDQHHVAKAGHVLAVETRIAARSGVEPAAM